MTQENSRNPMSDKGSETDALRDAQNRELQAITAQLAGLKQVLPAALFQPLADLVYGGYASPSNKDRGFRFCAPNEDLLEHTYWEYDAIRKQDNERLNFKGLLRQVAKKHARLVMDEVAKVLVQHQQRQQAQIAKLAPQLIERGYNANTVRRTLNEVMNVLDNDGSNGK